MSFSFDIQESKLIKDLWIIKVDKGVDFRGDIWTSFHKDYLEKLLPSGLYFKHDKFSTSKKDVLRGIHGDDKSYKLVTCVYGEILQVVVDCRKESKSYLKHQKFIINEDNQILLLLTPRMGNAHLVKSHKAVYHYKYAYEGEYADVNEQFTFAYNDERIGIDWEIQKPLISQRDLLATEQDHTKGH